MSIKYGTTDVNDVKINQNGTLVQVNKIVKDGVTLWQKGPEEPTSGGKWRGKYFGLENQILEWYSDMECWLDYSGYYCLMNNGNDKWEMIMMYLGRFEIISVSRYSKKIQVGDYVDITWSAT